MVVIPEGFEYQFESRPSDIPLPEGWTWEKVEAMRKEWNIPNNMVPLVVSHGTVGWGTINSVRLLREQGMT